MAVAGRLLDFIKGAAVTVLTWLVERKYRRSR